LKGEIHHETTQDSSDVFGVAWHTIGEKAIDSSIQTAIRRFGRAFLAPVGPDLSRGEVTLRLYSKRSSAGFLGMAGTVEKVFWESWTIPILMNSQPRAAGDAPDVALQRQRLQFSLEETVRATLLQVCQLAGGDLEHVPPIQFDIDAPMQCGFEILVRGDVAPAALGPSLHSVRAAAASAGSSAQSEAQRAGAAAPGNESPTLHRVPSYASSKGEEDSAANGGMMGGVAGVSRWLGRIISQGPPLITK
jgi:hypothetical protein